MTASTRASGSTDVGDHVVVHVALVRVERRRAHCVFDRCQPLDEIVGQRLPRRFDVLAAVELREQLDRDRSASFFVGSRSATTATLPVNGSAGAR